MSLKKSIRYFVVFVLVLGTLGFFAVERHPKEFFTALRYRFLHDRFSFASSVKPNVAAKMSKAPWTGIRYGYGDQKPVRGFQLSYLFDDQEKKYYYLFINTGNENLCVNSPIFSQLTGGRFVFIAADETKYLIVYNNKAMPMVWNGIIRMIPAATKNCSIQSVLFGSESSTSLQLIIPGH